MPGPSNTVAMKKVVQQLRFELGINRVKVSFIHLVALRACVFLGHFGVSVMLLFLSKWSGLW